jgi:hypothetical protein
MIPPPTPISPLTTPPASPIPISTGPGVDRFALAAAAPSIRGVYGPPRPRSLADSRWAGFLLSVHDKCTLDLMSPQPETWMSPPNPPRYAAFPSPTSALPPLPVTPAPHAVISVNAGIQSSSQTASASVMPAPPSVRPAERRPRTRSGTGIQSSLGPRRLPPECAPPRAKSFLEKTLIRAKPPHVAPRPARPTARPLPPASHVAAMSRGKHRGSSHE